LPQLIEAVKDHDRFVRAAAVGAIGAFGKESPLAQAALINSLNDDVVEVRLAAIEELGRMGPPAKAALPTLREARKNDNRLVVRQAAEEAIKRIESAK
jgi:HEAT repeat protein